jgi:hypothetical protein
MAAVQGCVQTYKKASVIVFRVRCHVQGLLGQGVAAVPVCKAATREDKAKAAYDLQGQQLVPTSQTELTPTSRC